MKPAPIAVSEDARHLMCDGRPFFYFADTVWNAFACSTVDEWKEFTEYRAQQGFNTLQYSALPVLHDASDTYTGAMPFHEMRDGNWDFTKPATEYFSKAKVMVETALERGLRPCITLIWNNYIQGTWANERRPDVYIPKDGIADVSAFIADTFHEYYPIFFISGDTKFETDEITEQYITALKAVKAANSESLTAMHIVGGTAEIPAPIRDSELLDLYIYQSGHNPDDQENTFGLAGSFYDKSIVRPVINSEPCYEGHGYGNTYGRFGAFHVRKAFWSSVLSGACAGFTYGAHGIWSWHRKGAAFTSEAWSLMPFDWRTAMRFQGSWDVAYGVALFNDIGLHACEPAQNLLVAGDRKVRVAATPDRRTVVVYVPYSVNLKLDPSLSSHRLSCIGLANRDRISPRAYQSEDGIAIDMVELNSDYLLILQKD